MAAHYPKPTDAPGVDRASRSTQTLVTLTAVALATACTGLTGCGGSNGVASKTPQEILKASETAVAKSSSATIDGTSAQGPLRLAISLKLTRHGGQGTIDLFGLRFDVIKTGATVYLKGTPSVYKRLGIKPQPVGTWVEAPATGKLSQAADLVDLTSEATRIITTSGKITKGTTTTIDGQPAIELRTETQLYKGRLFIKTTDAPYPLKLEKAGRETSHITFTNWNDTRAPTVPTSATTISR